MTQGLRWLRRGDLEEPVRRSCGVGQGDLEECEAHGGSGKADSRCEKEGDEEHRGIFCNWGFGSEHICKEIDWEFDLI